MIKSTELNPHYVIVEEIRVTILTRNVDPQPPSTTIFVEETLGFGLSNQESHKAPIGRSFLILKRLLQYISISHAIVKVLFNICGCFISE
jgi:hypothetical protein